MGATRRVSRVADSEAKPARPVQQPSKADVRKAKTLAAARAVVYRDSFLRRLRASIGPYRTVGESRRTASHSVPLVVDGVLLRLLHWTSRRVPWRSANARHGQDARGTPQTREVVLPEDAHSRASRRGGRRRTRRRCGAGAGFSGRLRRQRIRRSNTALWATRSSRFGRKIVSSNSGRYQAMYRPPLVGVPELRAQHHGGRAAQQRAQVLLRRPEGQARRTAPRTPPAPECGTPARGTARNRKFASCGFIQPNICCNLLGERSQLPASKASEATSSQQRADHADDEAEQPAPPVEAAPQRQQEQRIIDHAGGQAQQDARRRSAGDRRRRPRPTARRARRGRRGRCIWPV